MGKVKSDGLESKQEVQDEYNLVWRQIHAVHNNHKQARCAFQWKLALERNGDDKKAA